MPKVLEITLHNGTDPRSGKKIGVETGGSNVQFAVNPKDGELMVTRRLYAIEFWIATAGLAIYLALTEIGPRFKAERAKDR